MIKKGAPAGHSELSGALLEAHAMPPPGRASGPGVAVVRLSPEPFVTHLPFEAILLLQEFALSTRGAGSLRDLALGDVRQFTVDLQPSLLPFSGCHRSRCIACALIPHRFRTPSPRLYRNTDRVWSCRSFCRSNCGEPRMTCSARTCRRPRPVSLVVPLRLPLVPLASLRRPHSYPAPAGDRMPARCSLPSARRCVGPMRAR